MSGIVQEVAVLATVWALGPEAIGGAGFLSAGQASLMAFSVVYGGTQIRNAEKLRQQELQAAIAALTDKLATKVGMDSYLRTIYGTTKVGGSVVAVFNSGAFDQYRSVVVVFADHQITAYKNLYVSGKYIGPLGAYGYAAAGAQYPPPAYIGDNWVTSGAFIDNVATLSTTANFTSTIDLGGSYLPDTAYVFYANTDGSATSKPLAFAINGTVITTLVAGIPATVSYRYTLSTSIPRLAVTQHLGTPGEYPDSYLTQTFPTKWTSQHTLEGHAYCVFLLDLHQAEFQSSMPSFQAEIEGKPLYDYRTGATAYSENNALVLYDYMTGPYMRIPASTLPMADFISAANDCDDVVHTVPVYPQKSNRYSFNGVITSDMSPKSVLQLIAESMAGIIEGNTWSVRAGKYYAPVDTLQQSDIVGQVTVTPGIGHANIYNTVRGQYSSVLTEYVNNDYVPYVNSAYLAADGQELLLSKSFIGTSSQGGCYDLIRIMMEDSRNGLTVTADFSYKAWRLRVGDRVFFNSALLGFGNKIFRVTDKAVGLGKPVKLTLKEDDPSIWNFVDSTVVEQTSQSTLADPFNVPMLQGLTGLSDQTTMTLAPSGVVISRILLSWQPVNYLGKATVLLQWRPLISSIWQALIVSGTDTSAYLSPAVDGQQYEIRAQVQSVNLGAVSDWAYLGPFTARGQSLPPPDVAWLSANGNILTWNPVEVPDLQGYQIRFHYGTTTDWNSATPLHSGFLTQSPYNAPSSILGLVTFLIKAINTTLIPSNLVASATVDIGASATANILQSYDYGAANYPGTITGGEALSNILTANAGDSFYGSDTTSLYGADSASFYGAASAASTQAVYVTTPFVVSAVVAGSNLSLQTATQNIAALTVDYATYPTGSTPTNLIWQTWLGSLTALAQTYVFRFTLGSNSAGRPAILGLLAVVDAPIIENDLPNIAIASTGTVITPTKIFTNITNVQATIHTNTSGGVSVSVAKSTATPPVITVTVYNSSYVAIGGCTVDVVLKGY